MKQLIALSFFLILSACCKNQHKPSILVIGDSISAGWTMPAAIKSDDRYTWFRLTALQTSTWPENARNTNYTLRNVSMWLDWHPNLDIVIWNNGIWNCTPEGFVPPGENPANYYASLDQYSSELIQIAQILKSRVPRVIFMTTTQMLPVADQKEILLNQLAQKNLPPLDIEIVDLYSFTFNHVDWHIDPTNVHYTAAGNEFISEFVVSYLDGKK